jgi:dolichol-phosphate mannosyltransferase
VKPRLSLLVALLNEEENIPELYERLDRTFQAFSDVEFELIFIDDGSQDGSWHKLRELVAADSRAHAIRLSRNFGNHRALMAGLTFATGNVAMNLAADLQNPPEVIGPFLDAWRAGSEIVLGMRESRADSGLARLSAAVAYLVIRILGGPSIPASGIDLFLIDEKVVRELRRMSNANASIIRVIMDLGFRQTLIRYHRPARAAGRSKWTLAKKVGLLTDFVVTTSARPLFLLLALGTVVAVAGSGAVVLAMSTAKWWAAAMALLLSLHGLTLAGLALVGDWIRRCYAELGGRQPFIVSEVAPASTIASATALPVVPAARPA